LLRQAPDSFKVWDWCASIIFGTASARAATVKGYSLDSEARRERQNFLFFLMQTIEGQAKIASIYETIPHHKQFKETFFGKMIDAILDYEFPNKS
jgi:hypothetical protein